MECVKLRNTLAIGIHTDTEVHESGMRIKKVTPSPSSLNPALAQIRSQAAAVASFPRRAGRAAVRPLATGLLSLVVYALCVARPVTAFCDQSTLRDELSPQACQYVGVLFAGMLMGVALGPQLDRVAHSTWQLLAGSGPDANFRRAEVSTCIAVVVVSCAANLLFLLPGANQFVDLHTNLKTEAVLLLYTMGIATGGAWFLLLHRQAGRGLLVSSAMSMMVVASTLSLHSWP